MNKDLKQKIDEVVANMGNQELSDKLMAEAFALALTPEDKKEAGQYLVQAMNKRKRPDVEVRNMLGEMADALSLSYLAKRYFERDKTWLYHRLNNSNVNGKPASFSQQELIILADSLKDLSSKLSDISSNIASSLR